MIILIYFLIGQVVVYYARNKYGPQPIFYWIVTLLIWPIWLLINIEI